ncbi:MAG: glycoside hydrolase family 3 C-terminal domain-containing protein [Bryobacteraceae bacterium]|nr:glycoside hydrolase family 3 C-terminal domain-containing protein [Bryobacteraceae bacterium]
MPDRFLIFLLAALIATAQVHAPPPVKGPWMDKALSPDRRAELVVEQMTLGEKLQLVHGIGMLGGRELDAESRELLTSRSNGGAGFVPGIPRLGLPDLNMADSAVGVGHAAARSRYSTALPNTLALAASWDPQLAREYGSLIGRELRDQGYNMSLAGGVNLMREPRNGRNFEYLGEDPILAGRMVGQIIRGIQSQRVMGHIKHLALNDQETGRHIANVKLDKRSMRETDLLAFEIGIKEGDPSAVLCSYNRINGEYACENRWLLTDLLKNTWGFKGFVISDWFANYSATKAALAGLDQELPGPGYFGSELRQALESGAVPMARLDDMVKRIVRAEFAAGIVDDPPVHRVVDVVRGFEVAQKVAEQSMVLLKNSGSLPFNSAALKSIAVIGMHADAGVLSGSGSGQVDPMGGNAVATPPPVTNPGSPQTEGEAIWGNVWVWHRSNPLKAIRARAPAAKVQFHDGSDKAAAAALAKSSDVAVVFAVQLAGEGFDTSLTLPYDQDALIKSVAAANPRTVVVLENGNPVAMPWINDVSAVLEAWYPGIRGAEAIAGILFGDISPSGKLPASFPRNESDLPRAAIVPVPDGRLPNPLAGIGGKLVPGAQIEPFDIDYSEKLEVGYKWFEAHDKQALFPFGHGLSYTSFAYSDVKATADGVTFTLRNVGKRAGTEIAQIYAGLPAVAGEPPRRLVGWEKVTLSPGETKTLTVRIDRQFLAIFNEAMDAWELIPGDYRFSVGGSSANATQFATVAIQ